MVLRKPRWKRGSAERHYLQERCGKCGNRQLQQVEIDGQVVSVCDRCSPGLVLPPEVQERLEERGVAVVPGLQGRKNG